MPTRQWLRLNSSATHTRYVGPAHGLESLKRFDGWSSNRSCALLVIRARRGGGPCGSSPSRQERRRKTPTVMTACSTITTAVLPRTPRSDGGVTRLQVIITELEKQLRRAQAYSVGTTALNDKQRILKVIEAD